VVARAQALALTILRVGAQAARGLESHHKGS
jgi:hypothetical protein